MDAVDSETEAALVAWVLEAVATGEHTFPGRLSSHLADKPGPLHKDPFAWREVIERLDREGVIRIGLPNERIAVVSAEDVEARAAALAHVDNRTPMALEPRPQAGPVAPVFEFAPENGENGSHGQNPESPPDLENPEIQCALTGEGFTLKSAEPWVPEPWPPRTPVEWQIEATGEWTLGVYYGREESTGLARVAPLLGEMGVLPYERVRLMLPAVPAEPAPQPEPDPTPEDIDRAFDQARAEIIAAQPQPEPVKRRRRTAAEVAADKAARATAVAEAKAARVLEREQAKLDRARERVQAKQEAVRAKIAEAEGGRVELPAVVLRDGTVRHVSDADAWAVISLCLEHLFIDCENSGYPLGHQLYELRTIQMGGEHAAIVFDAADPAQLEIVRLALALAVKISAHSAGADAIPLVAAGLIAWDDIWAKMHDSVLYLKLIDPKLSGSDASKLKEVAGDLLPGYAVSPDAEKAKNALFKALGCLTETEVTTAPERSGWFTVSKNAVVMCAYAGSDVLDLAAVMRVLPPLPVAESVLDRERWFEAKCARVGYDGFKLDKPHIKEMIEKHEKARIQAQADVAVLSGNRISNPSSPEVAKALLEQFPEIGLGVSKRTGDPSAAKKELEKVARTDNPLLHHLCKQILEYRHNVTTLGLLLRPLETLCDYGDARMRPTVYTINADTGRCSCVRPNGQQFSRQGGIRASVVAGEMDLELVNGKWEAVR